MWKSSSDTVVFDNSASYLRSKKLRYWVDLISEEEEGISELTTQMDNTQIANQQWTGAIHRATSNQAKNQRE